MKNNRLENLKGVAGVFILVIMLVLAAALPIAVKLVQQRQENRSKATSETMVTQAKKCQNVGGVCQTKTSACAGTYIPNLCTGTSISCCTGVRDTDECLNVGGRCSKKTATGSGTFVHGANDLNLCSSKNGSDIDCWVATESATPCTAMGGTCATSSAKTSGGSCTYGEKTGFLDLTYSCKTSGSACCIPSEYDFNGVCAKYDGLMLTAIPEALCTSGVALWDGGDNVGSDGTINWKCKGFGDALTVDCSAKFKTINDTQKCLNVGGRCKDRNKEATASGFRNDNPDLCSESNPSNVGCWVAIGSVNPCTAMGGKCFGSVSAISGGACTVSDGVSGNYNLTYSCNAQTSACCLPTTATYDGKCKTPSGVVSSVPTDLCIVGTPSWIGGDNVGNDGVLDWKCVGSGGGVDTNCTAKIRKNGVCNPEYTDPAKSFTSRPSDSVVCSFGTVSNKATSGAYFTWKCKGLNGGVTASCKAKYDTCGLKGGLCVGSKAICTGFGGRQGTDSADFCGKNFCCIISGISPVLPTKIILNTSSVLLRVSESASLVATIIPDNTTDKTVTWSNSNPGVATIDSNGLVKAVSQGSTFITAKTTNGKIVKATVLVVAANVTIYPTSTLTPTPTLKLTLTPTPTGTLIPTPTGTLTPTPTGTLTPTPTGDGRTKISFKFSFSGVSPKASSCLVSLEKKLKIMVVNVPSNVGQSDVVTGFTVLSGETTPVGDQIFAVNNLLLDSTKFANVSTFNYLKIKGPFHLQAKMCLNDQSKYSGGVETCDINLTSGTVYNFAKYSLKPGDLDQDGAVTTVDFSIVKNAVDLDASPICGRDSDLNFDGVVNTMDLNLIKATLSSRNDE